MRKYVNTYEYYVPGTVLTIEYVMLSKSLPSAKPDGTF